MKKAQFYHRRRSEEDCHVLEERSQHDWGAKEKHVFKELGVRVAGGDRAVSTVGNEGVGGWQKYSGSKFWYSIYGCRLKLRYHSIVFRWPLHMQTKRWHTTMLSQNGTLQD